MTGDWQDNAHFHCNRVQFFELSAIYPNRRRDIHSDERQSCKNQSDLATECRQVASWRITRLWQSQIKPIQKRMSARILVYRFGFPQ